MEEDIENNMNKKMDAKKTVRQIIEKYKLAIKYLDECGEITYEKNWSKQTVSLKVICS